jgi:hypothetical protein
MTCIHHILRWWRILEDYLFVGGIGEAADMFVFRVWCVMDI